ncbi:MAG: hypothetical protein AAF986_03380 [Pseudomonadota bacterium]
MKRFLIILAWSSLVGAVADGAITLYAAWEIITTENIGVDLSVDEHLRTHLSFLYWVKDVAYRLLPENIVGWLFGLPALIYFPFRIMTNMLLSWWILRAVSTSS